jgi:hypothetical protein
MNEKKRRLIDDEIVVTLIYDFEVEDWSNEIMEEGIRLTSNLLLDQSAIEPSIPVLDLANKTALPKTPQP